LPLNSPIHLEASLVCSTSTVSAWPLLVVAIVMAYSTPSKLIPACGHGLRVRRRSTKLLQLPLPPLAPHRLGEVRRAAVALLHGRSVTPPAGWARTEWLGGTVNAPQIPPATPLGPSGNAGRLRVRLGEALQRLSLYYMVMSNPRD
jgi:hypothetical protein